MSRIDSRTLLTRLSALQERFPDATYKLARATEFDDADKPVWECEGAEEALASGEHGEYAILREEETEDGTIKQKTVNTARISEEGARQTRRRGSAIAPAQQIGKELTYLSDGWQLLMGNYQQALKASEDEKKRLTEENITLRNEIISLKSGNEIGELAELGRTAMFMWQNNTLKNKLGIIWREIRGDLTEEEQAKMSRLLTGALAKSELENEKAEETK